MNLHQYAETHEVTNQPPSLDGANLYRLDLPLLRLFRASNACDRRARPPGSYNAISRQAPKRSRANPAGLIGPKQT